MRKTKDVLMSTRPITRKVADQEEHSPSVPSLSRTPNYRGIFAEVDSTSGRQKTPSGRPRCLCLQRSKIGSRNLTLSMMLTCRRSCRVLGNLFKLAPMVMSLAFVPQQFYLDGISISKLIRIMCVRLMKPTPEPAK